MTSTVEPVILAPVHPDDRAEAAMVPRIEDRAGYGLDREPSGMAPLEAAIDELAKELEHLYGRLAPVLMPDRPSDQVMAEVKGQMSPFGEQVDRLRSMRRYLTEIHQRLDL